jgi:DNA-binding transcriptional MerR regulator
MKVRKYRSKDIQKVAKVSKINLNHWVNMGLILPLEDVRGRGRSRLFSHQNLIEALICRELNLLNLGTDVMRRILDGLRGEHPPGRGPSLWEAEAKELEGCYIIISRVFAFKAETGQPWEKGRIWHLTKPKASAEELGRMIQNCVSVIFINIWTLVQEAGGI